MNRRSLTRPLIPPPPRSLSLALIQAFFSQLIHALKTAASFCFFCTSACVKSGHALCLEAREIPCSSLQGFHRATACVCVMEFTVALMGAPLPAPCEWETISIPPSSLHHHHHHLLHLHLASPPERFSLLRSFHSKHGGRCSPPLTSSFRSPAPFLRLSPSATRSQLFPRPQG